MGVFGWSYPAGCSGTPWDEPDYPEECPVCGNPNTDPETEDWVCPVAPGFCSFECLDSWVDSQRLEAEAEANFLAELDVLFCVSNTHQPAYRVRRRD
jgi:hypothetical protein